MRLAIILLTAAMLHGCSSEQDTPPAHPVADMVLINGNVVTVDANQPTAEAIAIDGDRITAVGTAAEIECSLVRGEEILAQGAILVMAGR